MNRYTATGRLLDKPLQYVDMAFGWLPPKAGKSCMAAHGQMLAGEQQFDLQQVAGSAEQLQPALTEMPLRSKGRLEMVTGWAQVPSAPVPGVLVGGGGGASAGTVDRTITDENMPCAFRTLQP